MGSEFFFFFVFLGSLFDPTLYGISQGIPFLKLELIQDEYSQSSSTSRITFVQQYKKWIAVDTIKTVHQTAIEFIVRSEINNSASVRKCGVAPNPAESLIESRTRTHHCALLNLIGSLILAPNHYHILGYGAKTEVFSALTRGKTSSSLFLNT